MDRTRMLTYIDSKIPRAGVAGPHTSTNGVRFKIKTVHTGMRTAMFSPRERRTIRNTVLVLIFTPLPQPSMVRIKSLFG
jgi:hypothetical protein